MIASSTSWLDVVILALVQGLTEFLPISSSGHLVLTQEALGVEEPGVALEVILHLGTLLAVVLYYARDLWGIVGGSFRFLGGNRGDEPRRALLLAGLLVLATIPAAVGGILIGDRIESAFQDPKFVCIALIATGTLLLSTFLARRGGAPVTPIRALVVGLFQMVALFPGISRSGSTISGGLFLGLRPEEAARFSFLLSVPVILGAAVLKMGDLVESLSGDHAMYYLLGLLISFASGYLSIGILLRIVRRGRFGFFGVYCLLLGTSGWIYLTLH